MGERRAEDFEVHESGTFKALDEKDMEIQRLREALDEIANSKFCMYENTGHGQYGIGVTDGHRYCANIAKQALDNDQD